MTTDFRALCAELLAHAKKAQRIAAQDLWFGDEDDGLFGRADAALAEQPDQPSFAELLMPPPSAALAEQPVVPTPIPVAERLPGPGEWVWHCYAGVRLWELGRYNGRQFFIGDGPESQPATYWLPANALPVPPQ
jgi:hypothetical protein